MTTQLSKQDYLKKYLSDGDKKKKKKKKVTQNSITKSKIIDDDIDLKNMKAVDSDELEIYDLAEEAPQIAGIIDERPEEVRLMSEYRGTKKWKIVADEFGIEEVKVTAIGEEAKADDAEKAVESEGGNRKSNSGAAGNPSAHRPSRREVVDLTKKVDPDASNPRKRHDDSDPSPPRKIKKEKSDSDASPPRKSNKHHDSDTSPPRKSRKTSPLQRKIKKERSSSGSPPPRKSRKESDASPHRKIKKERSDSDASPPRKSKKYDSDASPPRKSRRNYDSDESPARKGKKSSRKRYDSDASPPRKTRRNKSDSDESLPRSSKKHRRSSRESKRRKSRSPEGKSGKREPAKNRNDSGSRAGKSREEGASEAKAKTLGGKKSGLQNAEELRKEIEELKEREKEMKANASGKNEAVVVRDRKTGMRIDPKEEARKRREKEEKEADKLAQYAVWGKGLKQVQDSHDKLKDDLYEMSKPLARYADDKDLDAMLKNKEWDGDPMLEYIRKKKKKKEEEEGGGAGGGDKPQYQGSYPANRYGIRPGHRWDGVDRSNGYERKWFEEQNARKAREEEAFKWSTADM